ncbi:calcium-binding protein [Sphingobium lactosutens]|uniref:calcium-binding protein n=1 Tax=Sphingobium lactosutens TaxID=522773 RepID=UPI0015BE9D22|nr:calcium-binding protein [Sphingobium lactosutens]NWK96856.1 calcium-binding protein [Sphingobium lactosutens]
MANYYNILGSQTLTGTSTADSFYLFNKDANQNNMRVDITFATFAWSTSLHLLNGTIFQLTGSNVYGSTDLVIGDRYDAIYGSNSNDFIAYNNGTFNDGLGGFQNIQLMYLGGGDDLVDLTAHGPGGLAYGKDMKIYAGDGNDKIVGGAGADVFYGEAGDDFIMGFAGADTIYGGDGNDLIYGDDFGADGSRSYDTLYGQRGDDIIYGGGRDDTLDGGDDNDVLFGGDGADSLLGGSGNDILYGDDSGTANKDKLQGGAGDDQLFGGGGNDELFGGGNNDLLDGGDGNDYLSGDAGDDTILATVGTDTIDGGADVDTVVFTGNRADYLLRTNADGSVTLTDQRAGTNDGVDTLRNVEFFRFADITLDATNLSTPPTIVSNGGGASAAISIAENSTIPVTTVQATDPDVGQSLVYRILGGADAALFAIDGTTGALTFRGTPDFENAIDADGNNVYDVIVAADDLAGGIGQQQLSITILDVADGNAPVITGGRNASVTVNENLVAATTIVANDPDGDPVSYAIVGGADGTRFTIDALTGALSFRTAPDYEAPTDANQDNVYQVTIAASDGTNTSWQTLNLSVANLNDTAPVLTSNGGGSTASISVVENSLAVTTVRATDADGSPLTYQITGGADAALFEIDANSGVLRFRAAPDYEAAADANHDNVYLVTVAASDGVAVTSQALSVGVANVNDTAPTITSNGGGANAALSMAENGTVVTTIVATDPDGPPVSYTIVGGADAALFLIDSATGALRFAAAPDFEHPLDAGANNVYDVVVAASDGTYSGQQAIAVTITDVNEIGRTLNGNGANETFSPTASGVYQTTALNDTIYAKGGNDSIDGGAGADYMDGGIGNDIYYVDTWSDNGWDPDDDQVIEAAGSGTDRVIASVSYRLALNVENLTLAGAAAISGWGNDLNNVIDGNAAANLIDGGIGNDTLSGGDGDDTVIGGAGTDIIAGNAGNDWLQGGAGNDSIDGGTGADRMEGGDGNDTYYVDAWSDDGNSGNDDVVVELSGGGTDLVNASISYVLANEVEKLTLTGSAAIDGTGNILANILVGNGAANHLWGLTGADTIDGGAGDDILEGGDDNDTLTGNTGNDRLLGGAMLDLLDGGDGNDWLDGGDSNDTLRGQAGADTLIGGKGKDVLTGGADGDVFQFAFGDTSANAGSNDTITDFATGFDKVDIDAFAGAPSRYAETAIASSNYADGLAAAQGLAGPSGAQAVFVAGSTDGWLFWDGNGDGTLDQAVILTGLRTVDAFAITDII